MQEQKLTKTPVLHDIIKEENRRSLNRPITGVIYEDRIWEQWYTEEAMNSEFPKMNQRDFMFQCNAAFPNHIILNNRGKKKFTVKQFEAMVDRFVNILYHGYYLRKGDIVCTIALSTPELVALKYACSTIGVITCNLNFMDADNIVENKSVLLDEISIIKPKIIFTLDILEDKVSQIINNYECRDIIKVRLPLARSTQVYNSERWKIALLMWKNRKEGKSINNAVSFKDFLKRYKPNAENPKSVYEPNMPSNIAFTSGTTGQNKAVMISHDANNALAYQQIIGNLGFKRGEKNLALVPPFLAFWDADIIHAVLCLGGTEVLELDLSYGSIPKYISKYLPQVGIWSQFLWDSILHLPDNTLKKISSKLTNVIVGGERAEINQQRSFYAKTGLFQNVGYGSSEVNTTFSFTHPNCRVLGSSGIPLPFNNIKIVDSDFKDLIYNQPGRLLISSPCLMLGYLERDDLTKQALYTDEKGTVWYDTKDYAYVDKNGCLFVLDRDKSPVEIIVGDHTEKVKLLDIVEKIKTDRCIKICKLMEYEGKLILHVVIDEFYDISKTDAIESIKKTITYVLPEKYYPDVIRVLNTLPRTPVGKVDYQKLNEDTAEIYNTNTNLVGKLNVVID